MVSTGTPVARERAPIVTMPSEDGIRREVFFMRRTPSCGTEPASVLRAFITSIPLRETPGLERRGPGAMLDDFEEASGPAHEPARYPSPSFSLARQQYGVENVNDTVLRRHVTLHDLGVID